MDRVPARLDIVLGAFEPLHEHAPNVLPHELKRVNERVLSVETLANEAVHHGSLVERAVLRYIYIVRCLVQDSLRQCIHVLLEELERGVTPAVKLVW